MPRRDSDYHIEEGCGTLVANKKRCIPRSCVPFGDHVYLRSVPYCRKYLSPTGKADLFKFRRNAMKKLLSLAVIWSSIAFGAPFIEAKTETSAAARYQWEQPQRDRWNDRRSNDRRWNDRRWNRGRPYSYVTTRIVRRWFRTYRETIRVTHLPNGRVHTQVLHRVRIR